MADRDSLSIEEEWRVIDTAPCYAVSNLGRVKRLAGPDGNGHFRKERLIKCAYRTICLCHDGKILQPTVASLVLKAFKGDPPPEKPHACHKDDDIKNNRLDNLYWGSQKDNYNDAVKNGRRKAGFPLVPPEGQLKQDLWRHSEANRQHQKLNRGQKRTLEMRARMSAAQFARWARYRDEHNSG